jgi:hypothetical protein
MIKTPYDWPRPELPFEDSERWPINAWRDAGVTLEVIDAKNMWCVFSNGIALPIIALYDADGFRVDEWEDARTYDFGDACFGYGTANAAKDAASIC